MTTEAELNRLACFIEEWAVEHASENVDEALAAASEALGITFAEADVIRACKTRTFTILRIVNGGVAIVLPNGLRSPSLL